MSFDDVRGPVVWLRGERMGALGYELSCTCFTSVKWSVGFWASKIAIELAYVDPRDIQCRAAMRAAAQSENACVHAKAWG